MNWEPSDSNCNALTYLATRISINFYKSLFLSSRLIVSEQYYVKITHSTWLQLVPFMQNCEFFVFFSNSPFADLALLYCIPRRYSKSYFFTFLFQTPQLFQPPLLFGKIKTTNIQQRMIWRIVIFSVYYFLKIALALFSLSWFTKMMLGHITDI